jgi:hypothetical protein
VQRKRNESAAILAIAAPDAQPLARRIHKPDKYCRREDATRDRGRSTGELIVRNAAKVAEFGIVRSKPSTLIQQNNEWIDTAEK